MAGSEFINKEKATGIIYHPDMYHINPLNQS